MQKSVVQQFLDLLPTGGVFTKEQPV